MKFPRLIFPRDTETSPFLRAHAARSARHLLAPLIVTAIVSLPAPVVSAPLNPDEQWHQWRGPHATGVAPKATPPLHWNETTNVKWKVKTPGFGTSTPIVWGNQVFLVTAIPAEPSAAPAPAPAPAAAPPPEGGQRPRGRGGFGSEQPRNKQRFVVLSLDRATGKTLWEKVAREELPHEGHHRDHGFASASPITDGEVLLAYFGSRGLYCYDLQGNLKWEKDFGDMSTRNGFGEGTSPALHKNAVVILWDHEGEDFILALDKNTGKELWRRKRDEPTGWSTPLIVEHKGKAQVVVNGTNKARSYDLATGELLWECSGQTTNAIPSPVAGTDVVYITSGYNGSALHAIRLDAKGDVTNADAVVWKHNKNTPYVPSPLLHDGRIHFFSRNSNILSVCDTKTGQPVIDAERIPGISGIYASPVAAGDRIYVLGRDGTTVVMKNGPALEVLATNKLDDKSDASLALVGNEIFLRGHTHLYCIAER
jgi:outer membrane protein assembly factor BamB